ncbi:MAG: glutamate synthase, partial [Chloroflexi bacterium]|nr:glutamate synthase [Chloroflexota bacterium]
MPLVYPKKTEMPCADPTDRRTNWDEVALGYTVERAVEE